MTNEVTKTTSDSDGVELEARYNSVVKQTREATTDESVTNY